MRTFALVLMCSVFGSAPAFSADTPGLDAAYQKEFAYLLAEKEALEKRLSEEKSRASRAVAEARYSLDNLQGKLIRLQTEAEQTQALLSDVERAAEGAQEGKDLVANTLFQARSALERDGFSLAEPADDSVEQAAVVLGQAFEEGSRRLAEGRTVRKEPGTYFLQDGTQVSGEVIRAGYVASYGASPAGYGSLKPIGKGRLQLWRNGGLATATALASGSNPDSLGIFLYESKDKGIMEAPEKTWLGYFEAGGEAGYVITALGVTAMILAILRFVTLLFAGGSGDKFVRDVGGLLAAGRYQEAIGLAKKGRGATGRVVQAIAGGFQRPRGELEDVIGEALLREQPTMDRFGTAIMVIAAVAPLLGLLGTVSGMIATFDIITEFGTGDPRKLSGGISEALVTTQQGLVVAIPSLLAGNLLSTWANGVMGRVERSALFLLNLEKPEDPPADGTNLREVVGG
jgi:biopolymer transport protein ExbB